MSLTQLESVEHAQAAVNQRLYQIAKRLVTPDGASVIEGEGGGIREVFRSTEARGLPRPQLIDTGVRFKALLWHPPADTSLVDEGLGSAPGQQTRSTDATPEPSNAAPRNKTSTRNEERVLASLGASAEPRSLRDLVTDTGLTVGQIRYALVTPITDGRVIMEGGQGTRSTSYRLNQRP